MKENEQKLIQKLMERGAEIASLPHKEIEEISNAPISSQEENYNLKEDTPIENVVIKWGRELFQRILNARNKYDSFDGIFKGILRDYSQEKLDEFLPGTEVLSEVLFKKLKDFIRIRIPYRIGKNLNSESVGHFILYILRSGKVFKRNKRGLSNDILAKHLDYEVNRISEPYRLQNKMKDDVFGGKIKVPKELDWSYGRLLTWLYGLSRRFYRNYQEYTNGKDRNPEIALDYLTKSLLLLEQANKAVI